MQSETLILFQYLFIFTFFPSNFVAKFLFQNTYQYISCKSILKEGDMGVYSIAVLGFFHALFR